MIKKRSRKKTKASQIGGHNMKIINSSTSILFLFSLLCFVNASENDKYIKKYELFYNNVQPNTGCRDAAWDSAYLVINKDYYKNRMKRVVLSAYVDASLHGERITNGKIVTKYSGDICSFILKIWPGLTDSNVLIGDGALFNEKYALLCDERLGKCRNELISKIILYEGISFDISFCVFNEPDIYLEDVIRQSIRRAELLTGDMNEAVLGYLLLWKMKKTDALDEIVEIKNRITSPAKKQILEGVILKMKQKQRITWGDIENLQYAE